MNMERQQWLAERRKGIGGSDVAPILGISPWASPLDVFLDKRGELPDQPENEAMRWGNILEPVVRQEYANRTGQVVRQAGAILQHPKHAFMLANLDGYTDTGRVFEAKTSRSDIGWGEPGSDEIPQTYLLQVQHYMAVTGYPVADVAVLIGGSDFRIYTVEADHELHALLIDAEAQFWRRVVENDPPEVVSMADALTAWGRASVAREVVASAEVEAAAKRLRSITEAIKGMEKDAESEKLTILTAMQDADTLVGVDGKVLATWKAAKPAVRFDTKALKEGAPDIYEQFAKPGEPTRRFLLK